jgi:hypothetical protein
MNTLNVTDLNDDREPAGSQVASRRADHLTTLLPRLAEAGADETAVTAAERPRTRAPALFASWLQPSQQPSPAHVRQAVSSTLSRLGLSGCLAEVAGEFGDHPECAAARMAWALSLTDAA